MKPMLSATVENLETLIFPLIASPKLDGIRCLKYKGQLISRNLKLIPNAHTQKVLEFLPEGVDGELIVGKPNDEHVFRTTTSGIMSRDGTPDVVFYAFDIIQDTHFQFRFNSLKSRVTEHNTPRFKLVQHQTIRSIEDLLEYETEILERGYEGVMLRSPLGLYKFGRSTLREAGLIKLKRFMDSEAIIIGFEEQMHNANEATKDELGRTKRSSHKANMHGKDTLGALNVRDLKTGVEFDIGTGFDDALRASLWKERLDLSGEIVKYKYFPTGSKDKPRFPVFLGFRDPIDL